MASLYNTLEADLTVAIAGSKMLYANGTIQEAGAVVLRDGVGHHIGRGFDRYFPIFNIERETHYVSGCSILIRKSFWDGVGGFDERYQVAYYEDSDLAMTARLYDMRVIYQPKSEVIHFVSQSYKKWGFYEVKKNARLFTEKWLGSLEPVNRL